MSGDRGLARAGGTFAVVLSALWAVASTAAIVVGVLLVLSGRGSDVELEGFAEFIGGSLAVIGGLALLAAVTGIVLGVRMRRGSGRSKAAPVTLFAALAAVSSTFLASSIADESGVDPGGVVLFGLNTAACLAIAGIALVTPRR